MIFGHRLKNPGVMMRVGLWFLIFASLWHWFVHPTANFSDALVDGLGGFLYGVSIGCLLLSVRKRGRRV